MKTLRKGKLPLLLLLIPFFVQTGFTPLNPGDEIDTKGAIVKVDGQKIVSDGMIEMDRDDTILFEAEGLKPNSRVDFKVKKMGVRFLQDSYQVDREGKIKEILYIPDMKIKVSAFVNYYNAKGEPVDLKFKFRII
ncbi:MAG: hypothetical protein H6581_07760 [Bacteroidia bacterium]|nr:hypothetical protein [Bacteroidia bacterium]